MSRSKILSQIQSAVAGSSVPELPAESPPFPTYADPVAEFVTQAQKVDVQVHLAGNASSLVEAIRSVLKETSCSEVFWESPEIFDHHAIPVRFRDPAGPGAGKLITSYHFRAKFDWPLVLNTKPYKRASLPDIELAALNAEWGVAETGTVGLQVRPGKGRMLSVLPPKIMVFLRADAIYPNLPAVLKHYDPAEAGSILTLVTGPSRTADIEKTLVLGVHGPKEVYVIIT